MKSIIEKVNSKANAISAKDEYNDTMSPFMQMLSIDNNAISELRLKKITVFDKIKAKFGKKEEFDEVQVYGSKSKKIIYYHYVIPEEIEKKKEELSNLKWNEIKRKQELKKEIKALENKKNKYRESILRWYYGPDCKNKPEQVQKDWQEYYLAHEQEMLEWIESQKPQLMAREDLSYEDKIKGLASYCEEYMSSVESFDYIVKALEKEIRDNVDLRKTVFGKDYRNAGLPEILQDIRDTMDNKLMPPGMTKYRKQDIPVPIRDNFFKMSSKASKVNDDMVELAKEYENMKQIEDKDEYIDKAISIFQRFIQIHPYQDGNGRTSIALLDIMLINRNIVPPVLYDTYYDRGKLDELSIEYLANSNKKPLQDYIKERIAKEQGNDDNTAPNRTIEQDIEME